MKFNSQKIFSPIIENVIKHPGMYLIVAVVLTILSVLCIAFKFDIRSDLKELMPQDAQVVQDTYAIAERVGSIQTLDIYLKTPELKPLTEEAKSSEEYQQCLASLGEGEHFLREDPPVGENWCDNGLILYSRKFVDILRSLDSVGNVGFHNDKSFFENNIALYASNEELEQAYREIDETLTEARRQSGEYKACLITADDEHECDALKPGLAKTGESKKSEGLDLKEQVIEKYRTSELANFKEFPLYNMGTNGWAVSLEVRFKQSTTGLKSVRREVERIEQLRKEMDLRLYNVPINVEYGGGLSAMKSEYDAIVSDIVRSISITILSILTLIALFFRSIRASLRIFIPLVMSTLWSLGLTFLTVGFLNLITAFIFAILIGLGIDFGIHLYARYISERRHGMDVNGALRVSIVETGSSLFFGALTTAAAFFTLMFGSFPGFSQFGFTAGMGVLLAFCVMTTVLPAFIIVMERVWPSKIKEKKPFVSLSAKTTRKLTVPVIGVCAIGLVIAGFCVYRIPDIQFEGNFYNLQLKDPPKTSAQKTIDVSEYTKSSSRPSSPTVAMLDNLEQVETLELMIRRNQEYVDYSNLRKMMAKGLPHFSDFLVRTFPEVIGISGNARSLPMMNAIARMQPPIRQLYNELPLYATYGSEKSQALQQYRQFVMNMPQTASWFSSTFSEVFTENTVANALPVVSHMADYLPEWLLPAIPTQRSSKQLNTISNMASIFSFLPGTQNQQLEKLATMERIRERTSDRQIRFLPEEEKEKIREYRKYLVDKALTVEDLPEWIKLMFKESGEHPLPPRPGSKVDYTYGNIAMLYQTTSTYQAYQADMLARDTRSIRIDGKPITAATGAFVYSDMIHLVQTDGIQISMIALIVILLIAMIQQRHIASALIVTLPVLSGLALTMSILMFFDGKLGLFNIIILPVTLGIGIDGAIYLYQRYQRMGRGSTLEAVRAVIGPVFMSSSTTLVGFGGMIMSRHGGLNTMGELAIIGISSCFIMTFMIQPGLILIVDKLKLRNAASDHEFDPQKLEEVLKKEAAEAKEEAV